MAEKDKDVSYSEFNPEHYSTMSQPETRNENVSVAEGNDVEIVQEAHNSNATPTNQSTKNESSHNQRKIVVESSNTQAATPENIDGHSYIGFNPEFHSTFKEPNVNQDNRSNLQKKSDADGVNESYTKFNPKYHSTKTEDTSNKKNRAKIKRIDSVNKENSFKSNYSNFKPKHHSSLDNARGKNSIDEDPIILETNDLLDVCLQKVMAQEKLFTSMACRVYNMLNDIKMYKVLVNQQDRFGLNYNSVFQALLQAGDYETVSTDDQSPEEEIYQQIQDTIYAFQLGLRGQNMVVKDVSLQTPERFSAILKFMDKHELRLKLLEDSIDELKRTADGIIRLKTQLHFIAIGE